MRCLVTNIFAGFHHTGPLENLNSLGNKYANKAYVYRLVYYAHTLLWYNKTFYSFEGMIAREALTVIDHNHNLGRQQVLLHCY